MIKLHVGVWSNIEDTEREYEISDELAEFLRYKAWGDNVDEEDEDNTENYFRLDMEKSEISSLLSHKKDMPEKIYKELYSLVEDEISNVEFELAIAYVLEEYPPEDWDRNEWMEEDMDDGLFTPSLSFEQFLEDENWDTSDENYDEEAAQEEYHDKIIDEYEDWVETLQPSERAERYGLDTEIALGYASTSYTFYCVDKAAEED